MRSIAMLLAAAGLAGAVTCPLSAQGPTAAEQNQTRADALASCLYAEMLRAEETGVAPDAHAAFAICQHTADEAVARLGVPAGAGEIQVIAVRPRS